MKSFLFSILVLILAVNCVWSEVVYYDFDDQSQAADWTIVSLGGIETWQQWGGVNLTGCLAAKSQLYGAASSITLDAYTFPRGAAEIRFDLKYSNEAGSDEPRINIGLGNARIRYEPNIGYSTGVLGTLPSGPGGYDQATPSSETVGIDQWHEFVIKINGGFIDAWVDGEQMFFRNDWNPYLSAQGNIIKISTWGGFPTYNYMYLDNFVLIDGQPATCSQVYWSGAGSNADFNMDCRLNMADLAMLASDWLQCNDPAEADCQ